MTEFLPVAMKRLQRKLAQRDARIAGLQRQIQALEHALAVKDVEVKRLPRDVTRAVQEALCNVRMVPIIGLRSNDRIVEVRSAECTPQPPAPPTNHP